MSSKPHAGTRGAAWSETSEAELSDKATSGTEGSAMKAAASGGSAAAQVEIPARNLRMLSPC